ncbi:MAG TPA: rod shape-determining protein MreC [Thermoleophilia bacterium]|nr:rod shape-determining protein MreC [Thermoleophilia bacterium]
MPRNKVAWRRLVFVVLIIASLALLTVSFRETDSGPVHAIQQAGVSMLSPLQTWGARAAKPFQDGYTWIRTLWSAHEEAERLAAELQQLQGEAAKLREQAEENERLRGLLEFQDKGTFPEGTEFVAARVIGKSPTRWEAWIEIDKGTADGIQIDQAVVGATPSASASLSGKGLVGKVVSVYPHMARVQLITDAESSVAAKIQGPRAEGIIVGSVSGQLTMDYVDRDILVDPKRIIVTSGYGGVYPPAIPIGIVANVGEEDVSAYKEIEVQGFVDFRVLEEVMVLIVPAAANGDSTATTFSPTTSTSSPASTGSTTSTTSTNSTTTTTLTSTRQ